MKTETISCGKMSDAERTELENSSSDQLSLRRTAMWLALFTIVYNIIEGIVSIWFGISEESFALAGFGADSLIEVGSAMIVLWKLRDHALSPELQVSRERKATFGIGILFLMLAGLTAVASGFQLYHGGHPETTVPGVVVSVLSLSFMFYLWKAKLRVGRALNSSTLISDAACSLACIKLSLVLFVGSVVFLLIPNFWWIDSAAALVLSGLIAKEGQEMISAATKPEFTGGCGCH